MTGSDHSDKEFRETRNLYVSMMSLYELADKLFGATYVAFMRAQDLSIAQISNLFSIQQILQAVFDYPTGTISDKIGRKKIMGYGFIVWNGDFAVCVCSKFLDVSSCYGFYGARTGADFRSSVSMAGRSDDQTWYI